ncbi:MAG: type VI secretion system baseplate subunit TssE [Planctomycetota bacterium]|nr:type VI secretion system baseplate subunit TssE [Planctomycetota bacterium]
MPELSLQERLQPSLLDRLADDAPEQRRESANQRVLTAQKLRSCVLRDLTWLLNSCDLGVRNLRDQYSHVATSVLNYGVPDFTGLTTSSVDADELAQLVRQAIWNFEPRIRRETLQVRVVANANQLTTNALVFEITGDLWAQPVPLELLVKTEMDLETGNVKVVEYLG